MVMRVKGVLCAEKMKSKTTKKTIMTLTDKQKARINKVSNKAMLRITTEMKRIAVLCEKIPMESPEYRILMNAIHDSTYVLEHLDIAYKRTRQ